MSRGPQQPRVGRLADARQSERNIIAVTADIDQKSDRHRDHQDENGSIDVLEDQGPEKQQQRKKLK